VSRLLLLGTLGLDGHRLLSTDHRIDLALLLLRLGRRKE
jgi:hypothetical protein